MQESRFSGGVGGCCWWRGRLSALAGMCKLQDVQERRERRKSIEKKTRASKKAKGNEEAQCSESTPWRCFVPSRSLVLLVGVFLSVCRVVRGRPPSGIGLEGKKTTLNSFRTAKRIIGSDPQGTGACDGTLRKASLSFGRFTMGGGKRNQCDTMPPRIWAQQIWAIVDYFQRCPPSLPSLTAAQRRTWERTTPTHPIPTIMLKFVHLENF